MAQRLSQTSYQTYHSQSPAVYASWLTNDVTTINQMGFGNVMDAVTQVFTVSMAIIALAGYHYSLVLATLVLAVVMYLVPQLFNKPIQTRALAMTHANERLMNRLSDILSGFDALNLLNLRRLLVTRTTAASQDTAHYINRWQHMNGISNGVINGVSVICQNLVLLLTGFLVWRHLVPIGTVSASINFAGTVFAGLTGIMMSLTDMQAVIPIFTKFKAVPLPPLTDRQAVTQFQRAMQMQSVSFSYTPAEGLILQDFTLTLEKGKKYALIGPSGSGKSTVLNLLVGNLTDYTGTITWDGMDYRRITPASLVGQVTYLDQTPFMFNDTLENNINMGEPYPADAVTAVLQRTGLTDLVASLPAGLTTMVEKDGHNLSGGQKQRVVLARGLLQGRAIVFMDESTAALDAASAQAIEQMIVTDPALTVVMVTHHLRTEIAARMDQIIESKTFRKAANK